MKGKSMATIGGFWPTEIKPDIQPPLAILKPRAAELTQLTKGILVGQISTLTDKDQTWLFHNLDAVVPALNNLRQRLVTVKHQIKMIYPAFVDAEGLEKSRRDIIREAGSLPRHFGPPPKEHNEASTDEELIELLKQALNSAQMKSTLVSLIALANQANEDAKEEHPEGPPEEQIVPPPEPDNSGAGLTQAPGTATERNE